MTKLLQSLGLAILAAISLTGCSLYFGEQEESWSYCAADGYYVCEDDDCEYAGAQCPAGGGGGGFACEGNDECAPGCYCQDGVCEEGGFCDGNEDCAAGFVCNTDRASCEPEQCNSNDQCDSGQICENGGCVDTCVCTNDREAQENDPPFGYCDENRSTCMPGTDPAGSCAGAVTCNQNAPQCAAGEVPLVLDGCYTGACKAISQCDAAPSCAALQHESDCLADNGRCTAVYTGINCTKPDGTACNAGDTNCTCESFRFNSCTTRTNNARVVQGSAGYIDFEAMFH
jgi:hypothetical protein